MRILYDHQAFAIQRFGGVSRYCYELASRIGKSGGCKVEILAPLYICDYFKASDALRPRGLRIPDLRGTRGPRRLFNEAVSRLLSPPRGDVDIFHETYYSRVDSKPKSALRIITVHDMIHEKFPGQFSDSEAMQQRKLLSIRRADHVICISAATRHDLLSYIDIDPARISIVHQGHDLPPAPVPSTPLEPRPYFLFVGLRSGYKNFDRLLEAYSRSPLCRDYSLLCFGGPPLSPAEHARIKALGLPDSAVRRLAGDDQLLAAYYASATALVYPSLYEGFGIPPLEAMALGCPVLCSDHAAIREVVGDAAEVVDASDAPALGAAMERIASSPGHAAALVARGTIRAAQFSWDRCARETQSVYRSVGAA